MSAGEAAGKATLSLYSNRFNQEPHINQFSYNNRPAELRYNAARVFARSVPASPASNLQKAMRTSAQVITRISIGA